MSERPEWHEVWMKVARQIAKRSLCDRDRVGAVIASETNRIVAVGYNNPPAKFDHQGRTCLAWCPRARDMAVMTGYEYDNANAFKYEHRITEWNSGPFEQTIEVDGCATYVVADSDDADFVKIMESCGWLPRYVKSKTKTTSDKTCPSLHAEANALSVCDRSQREGGTIYVTSYPCYDCAKLIANSGLHRVVYRLTKRGAERMDREKVDSIEFLRSCGVEVDVVCPS